MVHINLSAGLIFTVMTLSASQAWAAPVSAEVILEARRPGKPGNMLKKVETGISAASTAVDVAGLFKKQSRDVILDARRPGKPANMMKKVEMGINAVGVAVDAAGLFKKQKRDVIVEAWP
ncbi:hypothetical protein C8J56DRAFT_465655 [Mycena floridula]|nr:hypothetical protein C8J56DRAFT_465655 [Mycena floridula]